jgi:aspartate aminotransferase-like enzyme
VLTAAAALGSVLERHGVAVSTEKGIEAALAVYGA